MDNFLIEYGLFLAKAITIVVSTLMVIAFSCVIIISKKKRKEESYIEIENINQKLEELQESLELEILGRSEYKKLLKSRKKEQKQRKKNSKGSEASLDNQELEQPKLFVLTFNGDLHASEIDNLREEITAILTVAKHTDEVLLKLESSGGMVPNYGFAAAQLQRIKQHNISLVVAVDLVAASGGYMMACVANKIIAAPFAIIGSIGVLGQIPNFNKLLQKHYIDIEHHTSGEYKSTLTMLGKNTNKGREKFIEELEYTHTLFKEHIKYHRSIVDLKKIATGEYWYAIKALSLNLIDEIKTSDDYLIDKKNSHQIFSIEHKIHRTLKEKISNMLSIVGSNIVNMILEKSIKKGIIT